MSARFCCLHPCSQMPAFPDSTIGKSCLRLFLPCFFYTQAGPQLSQVQLALLGEGATGCLMNRLSAQIWQAPQYPRWKDFAPHPASQQQTLSSLFQKSALGMTSAFVRNPGKLPGKRESRGEAEETRKPGEPPRVSFLSTETQQSPRGRHAGMC